MPRNGSGVYSKPAGTTVTPNTTISSSTFNAVVDDFVSDANAIRPVSAGGTGAANIEAAADALGAMRKAVYDPDGNGVVDRAAQADSVPWSGVADKPASYPPAAHSHVAAGINDASDAGRALLTAADAAAQRTALGLGTAARGTIGVAANNVVALDAAGKLPALNGSQLTGIAAGGGPRRHTVIKGPTTAGAPSILAATYAGLIVTTQNISAVTPLLLTAAMGFAGAAPADRYGVLAENIAWPAVAANATSYLPLAVAADGSVTAATPQTLKPNIIGSGAASATNGQYTYVIADGQMYLGDGSAANAVAHVIAGLVVAGASSITATVAYAYGGYYESNWVAGFPSSAVAVSKNHNLGSERIAVVLQIKVTTAIAGYAVGDILDAIYIATGGNAVTVPLWHTDLACGFIAGQSGSTGACVLHKTTSVGTLIAGSSSVSYRLIAWRLW